MLGRCATSGPMPPASKILRRLITKITSLMKEGAQSSYAYGGN
jgi:hypothetical protein